jgi:hypothetical protein
MPDRISLPQKTCTYALLAMTPYPQVHPRQLHEDDAFRRESKVEQPRHRQQKQAALLITD